MRKHGAIAAVGQVAAAEYITTLKLVAVGTTELDTLAMAPCAVICITYLREVWLRLNVIRYTLLDTEQVKSVRPLELVNALVPSAFTLPAQKNILPVI